MGVSSYAEFITVVFGWVMYDRLWAVLNDTGLVYVPFIAIIVKHVLESRKGGDDEGSAAVQSLKKIETDVFVALFVLILAVVPSQDVVVADMEYLRPRLDCAVDEAITAGREPARIDGGAGATPTGTSYDGVIATLGGQTGRIPVWWGFVHWVSKAVVAAGVAGVPCSADIAGATLALAQTRLTDPSLPVEVEEFRLDCHQRVLQCAKDRRFPCMPSNTPEYFTTRDWMGSSYFRNTPGYYDAHFSTEDRRPDWTNVASRDAGRDGGAHPSCKEWWEDGSLGLRARLLAAIPLDVRQEMLIGPNAVFMQPPNDGLSATDREDLLLRQYLGVRRGQQALSYDVPIEDRVAAERTLIGKGLAAFGELLSSVTAGAAAAVGAVTRMPGNVAAGMAIRDGLPVFMSLLLMVFVVCLPVLQLIGRYDIGMVMTLTIIFFAFQFCYVLWAVAFWVDNHFTTALTGSEVGNWVANPVQSLVILWLQRLMYQVFPMVWIAALTWVGINVGDAFSSAIQGPLQQTAQVAEKAADDASSAAQKSGTGFIGGLRR